MIENLLAPMTLDVGLKATVLMIGAVLITSLLGKKRVLARSTV